MPIQVLEREKLDTSGATNAIQSLQDTINAKKGAENKRAMLKYYADELKLKAKTAEDEVEKAKLTAKASRFDTMSKVFAEAVKSGDPQGTLMTHFKLFPEEWENVAREEDFKKRVDKLKPSGEEKLKSALAQKISGGTDQAGIEPNREGAVGGQPISQPTDEGYSLSPEMSVGGISLVNQSAKNRQIAQETSARKGAEQAVELAPLRSQMQLAKALFAESIKEMGGLGDTALGARLKGYTADVGSEVGNMPATQTLNKVREGLALSLGSFMNRGRPTDKDQKAAFMTLFSNKYPLATNMYLMQYVDAVLSGSSDYGQLNVLTSSVKTLESYADIDREVIKKFMEKGLTEAQANEKLLEIKMKRAPFGR